MKIGKTIGLRTDEEIRAAIEALGAHLGTENLSQIARTAIVVGCERILAPGAEAAMFSRQAFREGVLAGAAAVKSQIESAISEAMQEAPHGDR